MNDETVADYVTVEVAGKRGKRVSMGKVAHVAELVGKPLGNAATPDG
jgi:hypothetical protein